jgi:alkanesulfonate monooxygenase SsuD/methylene tetrahydromethanopterin reductase-like flavin-dependent oxidoreductase (luciferase family)
MAGEVEFATGVPGRDFQEALAVAQAAETAGFTSVSFADRPFDPVMDGWTLATAVAARTERIRLFHTTLNIPYRLPQVIAKEAATLDLISGGRLDLCLGAGGEGNRPAYDSFGLPMPGPGERLQDLRDAIAIIRGLWSNERFTYEGRVFRVRDANGEPKPAQGLVPIWVGALLPRSLRLTGQLADGFIKNRGWGSIEEVGELNRRVSNAASKAGRDPASIKRILNGAGFVARDAAEAEEVRSRLGAAAGGLIGTPEQILETIKTYQEAGVTMFLVRFQGPRALEQIKAFGSQVIPAASKS